MLPVKGHKSASEKSSASDSQDLFTVAAATGELDVNAAVGLRAKLNVPLLAGRPRVVLDLSEVTFLDCAALAVLIEALHRAQTAGGWLHLVAPCRVVRRLLDLAGMAKVFPSYPSISAAGQSASVVDVAPSTPLPCSPSAV